MTTTELIHTCNAVDISQLSICASTHKIVIPCSIEPKILGGNVAPMLNSAKGPKSWKVLFEA